MQLIINLNFPFGRFHGREFPPSPSRLFQSLIAGSHRGIYEKQNVEARDGALEWLENLAPPLIETCQSEISGANSTNYVPNNDNAFSHNRTAKSLRAFVLQNENAIRFVWNFPANEENNRNAEVICKMTRLVTHLGHGQDAVFARGEIVENSNGEIEEANGARIVFRPKLRDGGDWAVPTVGALASYQRRYQRFLETGNSHTVNAAVRQVEYISDDTIDLTCPYALFEIRETDNDEKFRSFDGRDLRQPAAMARHAVSEFFETSTGERFKKHYGEETIAGKVFGHKSKTKTGEKKCVDGAHLAFIPLPNLYPDGKIRRVLIAGFSFETERERELFGDITGNLNGAEIKDGGVKTGKLLRVKNMVGDAAFPKIYARGAKVWRSVTPIVLSGFNRRGRKPEQLLYRALNQIGIGSEAIESVAVFRSPIVPKTFRPMDYKIAPNDYLNESPRYHAEIIFKRPVRGVLVVGRGRHAGFGLMMPFD